MFLAKMISFAKTKIMRKTYFFLIGLLLGWQNLSAQTTSLNQTIRLWAEVGSQTIKLNWPLDTRAGSYTLYRKEHFSSATWSQLAQLNQNDSSYTDTQVQKGILYDYQIRKSQLAQGQACAAIDFEPTDQNGTALLLVQDKIWQNIESSIAQLQLALWAEGWKVRLWRVGAEITVEQIKAHIISLDILVDLQAVVILGAIPVPYSGDCIFDGHQDHMGAWPADVFYTTFGQWTDNQINRSTARRPQNHNIPSDGKYDQTYLPARSKFQIGRIDFEGLNLSEKTASQLIEGYIARNIAFRKGQTAFQRKALVDDNFTGLNLASTGWANYSNILGAKHVQAQDYFTTLEKENYLLSYGCGGGSYTSCSGVGTSADFFSKPLKHNFTMLAGSYFGDWDNPNNLMRSAVATSALACGWGGIPMWHIQHTALGMTVGYGVRLTQNNTIEFFNGNFNASANAIHIALMGDPTLRLFPIQTPQDLSFTEEGNSIRLTWQSQATNFLVYRIDTAQHSIHRLTSEPISAKEYLTPKYLGNYLYSVRAVQTETTGAGTFRNLSAGALVSTTFTSGFQKVEPDFLIYPNPSTSGFSLKSETEPLKIEIYDSQGRRLCKDYPSAELEKGLYVLKIFWPNGSVSTCKWLKR
jgi:hypothetical protein